jgi:hypothetical protein
LGSVGHAGEVNITYPNSHADAIVVGRESLIIQIFDHPVMVSGFDPTRAAKSLRTVSAALAYTIPKSDRTVCLIVHQTIYEPNLSHNILSTIQIRLNYVMVNDPLTFQYEVATNHSHIITIGGQYKEVLAIPMFIKGVTSCFTTRKPNRDESENCDHFDLTYEIPEYDPHCPCYASQEAAITAANGQLMKVPELHPMPPSVSVDREISVMQTE